MWIETAKRLPPIDKSYSRERGYKISVVVLIWVEGYGLPHLARYNKTLETWYRTDGVWVLAERVKYWQPIDNPYNKSTKA